jgi:hypothetical protein
VIIVVLLALRFGSLHETFPVWVWAAAAFVHASRLVRAYRVERSTATALAALLVLNAPKARL